MHRSALPLLACAAAVAAGAGCGQSSSREQVREVATRFAAAVAAGDGAAACRQLAPAAAAALERQERRDCPAALAALRLQAPGPVAAVRLFVTSGQVVFDGGDSAFLDRGPEGWRLSAIGCRFDDGKPASRPATCAAEA